MEKFRYWNWVLQLIAVCIAVQFFAIILFGPLQRRTPQPRNRSSRPRRDTHVFWHPPNPPVSITWWWTTSIPWRHCSNVVSSLRCPPRTLRRDSLVRINRMPRSPSGPTKLGSVWHTKTSSLPPSRSQHEKYGIRCRDYVHGGTIAVTSECIIPRLFLWKTGDCWEWLFHFSRWVIVTWQYWYVTVGTTPTWIFKMKHHVLSIFFSLPASYCCYKTNQY